MAIKRVTHSSQFVGDYSAPELFPDEARYRQYKDKRDYVKGVLMQLAKADALLLTDVACQPKGLLSLAHEVIMGFRIAKENDGAQVYDPVPRELSVYRVRVESTNGKPLRWKTGREPARVYGGLSIRDKQRLAEDVWMESDSTEEVLAIQDAWILLRQMGEHARHAPSEKSRRFNWRAREIKPVGYDAHFGASEEKPAVKARKAG